MISTGTCAVLLWLMNATTIASHRAYDHVWNGFISEELAKDSILREMGISSTDGSESLRESWSVSFIISFNQIDLHVRVPVGFMFVLNQFASFAAAGPQQTLASFCF